MNVYNTVRLLQLVDSEMDDEDSQMEIDREEIDLVSKHATCKNCAVLLFAPAAAEFVLSCVPHNMLAQEILVYFLMHTSGMSKKFLHVQNYQAL